jgi:hypothetical protein
VANIKVQGWGVRLFVSRSSSLLTATYWLVTHNWIEALQIWKPFGIKTPMQASELVYLTSHPPIGFRRLLESPYDHLNNQGSSPHQDTNASKLDKIPYLVVVLGRGTRKITMLAVIVVGKSARTFKTTSACHN